jgi:predicted O-methyltransferase YrrM
MQFIDEALDAYVCDHTSPASDLLNKINRDTHIEVLQPRMLSGHFQGRLLSMLSKMIRPERILEIGTYTGYSALCLAEGLTPTGKIVTMDINEELESRVRNYFCSSQFSEQIDYRIGDASTLITGLNEQWDLVFIDADKQNYLVLWSGKVIEDDKQDKDTILIRQFNEFIKNDERVECIMLPVRDGLTIVRKR